MQLIVKALAVLSGIAFGLGFMGQWLAPGDSFAVIRLPVAVVFALTVTWSDWPARVRWPLSALPIIALAHIASLKMISDPAGQVTAYQKNLLFKNADVSALAEDIRAVAPDAVFLQELSPQNDAILAEVQAILPTQAVCPFTSWASVAVLSRWPAVGAPVCEPGLAAQQVAAPTGPLWLVSLHLHWPWPYGQAAHLDRLLPVLETLEGPVLLGGDFNMVPWGASVVRIETATATRRAGPVHATITKRGMPLPIDFVLAPSGGKTAVRPLLGSDHHGVVGRLRLTE